ncbi:MAG TPA: phosphotransferase [Candidatus Limnocylindrales bacterium]|nr:phosphotransferase [Candidatus Limnocylindrales bacterium]
MAWSQIVADAREAVKRAMIPAMSPGPVDPQPFAVGRTAEVYGAGDGEVLKVLRPGLPEEDAAFEAELAGIVDRLGVPAPRFLGLERHDGRPALRYERLDGPSMLDRLLAHPWEADRLAVELAGVHAEILERDGTGLPDLFVYLDRKLSRARPILGKERASAVRERMKTLRRGSALGHGDLHPLNVLLTSRGPVAIDWEAACFGPPEADIARTLFLLLESDAGAIPWYRRPVVFFIRRRFAVRYFHELERRRPIDRAELVRWRLPILAARLAEDIEVERSALLARIDAELDAAAFSGR